MRLTSGFLRSFGCYPIGLVVFNIFIFTENHENGEADYFFKSLSERSLRFWLGDLFGMSNINLVSKIPFSLLQGEEATLTGTRMLSFLMNLNKNLGIYEVR